MEFVFYTFLYALLLHATGYIILKLCRIEIKDAFTQLFIANVTGAVFVVWLVAFIRTSGITVMNALWIPVLTIALYAYKNKLWNKEKIKLRFAFNTAHGIWAISLIFMSIINYLFNLGYSVSHPSVHNIDTIYYVRLSEFIYHTGIESTNIDYLQIKPNHVNPYHYFTPWLQAGFNVVFSIENNYLVRKVIVFSVYFSMFYVGLLAVLKNFTKNNTLLWYHFVIPVFLFFIKPIGLGGLTAKIYGSYALYWVNSLIQLPKHSPIMMVLLVFVLLMQNKQYTIAALSLLFLPVFYVTTAPAVFALIFCIIIWVWIKKIKDISVFYIIVSSLLVSIYLVLFYAFHPKQNYIVNPTGNNQKFFWERFSDISFINILLKDAFQVSFAWLLSLSILIVLTVLLWKNIREKIVQQKHVRFLVYFSAISFIVSFLVWQILYYINDSEQFFACFSTPVFILSVFLYASLLLEMYSEKKKITGIILIGIYGLVLLYSAIHASRNEIKNYKAEYSAEYVDFIRKNKDRFSEYGAMLIDDKYIWYLYFHGFPKPYIQNKNPRDFLALNICELQPAKESYDLDKLYIPLFSFYQYVEKQKAEKTFTNLSESKLEFVKKYKINHIVANKTAKLDSIFLPYVTEKYTDKVSGETLYFLDIPQK